MGHQISYPFYMYVEAVNLDHFITDTNQLSIVRGGGLSLLEAPELIADEFSSSLELIYSGASEGAFGLQSDSFDAADAIKASVIDWLANHDIYKFGTFVTAISSDDDLDGLKSIAHRQQMQSPNFVYVDSQNNVGVCEHDMVRPRDEGAKVATKYPCEMCRVRFEVGKNIRENFDSRVLKNNESNRRYTDNLQSLSSQSAEYPWLQDKVALFYADGNQFGLLAGRSLADKAQFSTFLQDKRSFLMQYVLQKLEDIDDDSVYFDNESQRELRIETLLWGGDELVWVVPAWLGVRLAQWFFEHTAGLAESIEPWQFANQNLTHSAALVIANNKTPIRQLRSLAYQLVDEAKIEGKTLPVSQRNRLSYQVLESIDVVGADYEVLRQLYKPITKNMSTNVLEESVLSIDARQLCQITPWKQILVEAQFPHGPLLTHLRRGLQADDNDAVRFSEFRKLREIYHRIDKSDVATPWQIADTATMTIADSDVAFVHLVELWDYIV